MANWWEISEQEIQQDADALQARSIAYFNTLYRNDDSRFVLLDIEKLCYERHSSAEATLACIELFHQLKGRAGLSITGEKAAIDAEAASLK